MAFEYRSKRREDGWMGDAKWALENAGRSGNHWGASWAVHDSARMRRRPDAIRLGGTRKRDVGWGAARKRLTAKGIDSNTHKWNKLIIFQKAVDADE
jgi:hypothetical protein